MEKRKNFESFCVERGIRPTLPSWEPPRSKTIEEELVHLREEWKIYPDKRWHIERRANMLIAAQSSIEQQKFETDVKNAFRPVKLVNGYSIPHTP